MDTCPLGRSNVEGDDEIWGYNLGYLTGKTPQQKTLYIRSNLVPIPMEILQCYCQVILLGDGMYVNSVYYINTISLHVNFLMTKHIANSESNTLKTILIRSNTFTCNMSLKLLTSSWVANSYALAGTWPSYRFTLMSAPAMSTLDSERLNCNIKEMSRGIYNTIKFEKVIGCMITELIALVVFLTP